MRIEKINENQIRCILSNKDLADRQIKLSELAYGSEKARDLFRDMIEQANDEFGFEADDMPLMIEAMPLSGENIILQITKIENPEELEDGFIFPEIQGWKADDFSSQTEVFAFKSLDQIERVAYLLDGFYEGENDLYKNERLNQFFLIIHKSMHTDEEFHKVCNVISEYANRREKVAGKEAFLKEHGKLLVKGKALQMLGEI